MEFSEEKIDLSSDVNGCKREEHQDSLQRQFVSHTFSSLTRNGFVESTSKHFSQSFVLCLGFSEDCKTQTMSLYGRKVQALTLGKISFSL